LPGSVDAAQLPDGGPSPFAVCVADEAAALLARCCAGMPVRHRQLLAWRYRDALTFGAIAGRWGVTEVAVHRMHGRLLVTLRARLAELRVTRLDEVI
jgi:DNA-directed RNA polymerase specialized sigma subunit